MATIGQALTSPESGWRRYDDTDSRFLYKGTSWSILTNDNNMYGGSYHMVTSANKSTLTFKFYGTKLRLMGARYTSYRCANISVSIDNIIINSFSQIGSLLYQNLDFEKTGLTLDVHTAVITIPSDNYCFDSIDIDSSGYLVHPILNQVQDINSMQVGDVIPCKYTTTTSGAAGYFSELGTCIANEIPVAGTATPDGLFYFIKGDKGTLIADRVIQTNISWDALNLARFIEGTYCAINNLAFNLPIENYSALDTYTIDSPKSAFDGAYYGNMGASTKVARGYWISSVMVNNWIQVKLSKPSIVRYLKLQGGGSDGTVLNRNPKDCILQGSNDGINFTNIQNLTFLSISTFQSYLINNSTAYLYYRLFINNTNNSVDYLQILELQLFESVGVIRSMSGGCAYLDAYSNSSTIDKELGAWPTTNEWDKYIVKSDLNGKITPGDDNVWHWNLWNWCKDTVTTGITFSNNDVGANTKRCIRGQSNYKITGVSSGSSTIISTSGGFRPLLNYIESDIASEVIY